MLHAGWYTNGSILRLLHRATPARTDVLVVNGTRAESSFEKIQAEDVQARWHPLSVVIEEEEALGQSAASSALPTREWASLGRLILVVGLTVENVCAHRL